MAFTCQVCFEERVQRLGLPKLATGNGDVLRAGDCLHPICQECLATFVKVRVDDQFVFNLRCPFVGCANELFEQDVARLVQSGALPKQVSERFAELRTRDYSARAASLSQDLIQVDGSDDLDMIQRIWHTMRLCPRCNLAIERSEGCNSFYCICGHHFDFAVAPRVVGGGSNVRNYGQVIDTARGLKLSLKQAETYGEDKLFGKHWSRERAHAIYRMATKISSSIRIAMDDACDLVMKAKMGDEEARARIRASLGRTNAGHVNDFKEDEQEEEEEEEETPYYDTLWANSSSLGATQHEVPTKHDTTDSDANAREQDVYRAMKNTTIDKVQEEERIVDVHCLEGDVLNAMLRQGSLSDNANQSS